MQQTKKIAEEMLNTSSCKHNDSGEKSCAKPRGGESCAFDGSYVVLNPIRDAAHLVHGSIACCGHNYESRGSLSSGSRMYRYGFTTEITELDIIYGAEEKLLASIEYVARTHRPAAVFVYQTCVPALTGEDVESICETAQERLEIPVIPVVAPGFLGHKNLGNRIAGDVLMKHVIGTGEPESNVDYSRSINLIGEYNIAGEQWDIMPLFRKIGIHVAARMTGDSDFEEITRAHHARANLLVCGRALVNLAVGMEERYGMPYSEVSFFGMENTSRALREAARLIGDPAIIRRTEEVIAEEEGRIRRELDACRSLLDGKRAVVYTGGVKSWSMILALRDLGIEVTACGTKKSSLSDIEKMRELIGEERILNDTSPANIMRKMRETNADILIAGGRNQYLANKEKIPFIDVNQEKHTPYAGYAGILNMAHDIIKTIDSPVWKSVKREAPWNGR